MFCGIKAAASYYKALQNNKKQYYRLVPIDDFSEKFNADVERIRRENPPK